MNKTENTKWTERLKNVMPWGSSTCSKAPGLIPEEPGVIVKGKGCRVWDADGREFIDFRNALGPITLGYQFPAVDEAIKKQMENGIIYGHPHILECEVAEMLCDIIPCAEQVRFLKTGGEANAACIRLARYYTGREHIIQIGYNGWLNSLSSGGQLLPGQEIKYTPPGVPKALSALHHSCKWNDMDALKEIFSNYDGQIAAVVVSADYPNMKEGKDFYPALRELTQKHGALLIFDEIVTGFRIALSGVQEYFKVVPDLAIFAKGIANGMPLSAYVGKREIMSKLERGGLVVSSTYAGETLSLAAAKAAINTYVDENVVDHLWKTGEKIWGGLNKLFQKYHIPMEMEGMWPCPALTVKQGGEDDTAIKFLRAAYRNGISLYRVSYVNYSHKENDIDEALQRLERACSEI